MKKIFYFTNSFPFGLGENWKYNELCELNKHFKKIEVIPYSFDGNDKQRNLNFEFVTVNRPLYNSNNFNLDRSQIFRILLSRYRFFFIYEFFKSRVFKKRKWIISFLNDSVKTLNLIEHPQIIRIIKEHSHEDIFYFFWGKGACLFIPLLKKKIKATIFVRFHGYDLYLFRNNNYIPFRGELMNSIDYAVCVSSHGKDYLKSKYPQIQNKVVVNRLGSLHTGHSKASEDGVLRIFSCSALIPLKRVSLLAMALTRIHFKVEWTHIGDGIDRIKLMEIAKGFPSTIDFNHVGWVSADQVLSFYNNRHCDLFINVSETEGLPVSIMEALSFGIPVYATDVGGVKEIVNITNGKLLPSDISVEELSKEIIAFYLLPNEQKLKLRRGAFSVYMEDYNAEINAKKLIEILNRN